MPNVEQTNRDQYRRGFQAVEVRFGVINVSIERLGKFDYAIDGTSLGLRQQHVMEYCKCSLTVMQTKDA